MDELMDCDTVLINVLLYTLSKRRVNSELSESTKRRVNSELSVMNHSQYMSPILFYNDHSRRTKHNYSGEGIECHSMLLRRDRMPLDATSSCSISTATATVHPSETLGSGGSVTAGCAD